MKVNTEKFDALVSDKTSGWHKEAEDRITNKAVQDKEFDSALRAIRRIRANKINRVKI